LVGVRGIAPPRLTVSETGPSAVRGEPHAVKSKKMVHPAGLPPADSPFEAEDDCNFTTDAKMARRAEARVCGNSCPPARCVLRREPSLTPVSRAKAGGLPRTCTVFRPGKSRSFTVKVCNPIRLDEHRGIAPRIPVWKTGVYLSTLMLEIGALTWVCTTNLRLRKAACRTDYTLRANGNAEFRMKNAELSSRLASAFCIHPSAFNWYP
jgi:hypothetical protein